MEFIDFSGGGGFHEDGDEALDRNTHYLQSGASLIRDNVQNNQGSIYGNGLAHPTSCDIKPRLTKEQADLLESHYKQQPKPNTATKKGFAEQLNVSLDKVNNWFQNRRAKTKQDIKKAQGQLALAQQFHNRTSTSDTEPSPFEPSNQYAAMMQQMTAETQTPSGRGITSVQQTQPPAQLHGPIYQTISATAPQHEEFSWQSQSNIMDDLFQSQEDINRRTLTQEGFNAIARNGGMMNGHGQFQGLSTEFSNDSDIMNQVFGIRGDQNIKQHDLNFPYPVGAPLPSDDSTVPSVVSEQSFHFPSDINMQNFAAGSTASSDWSDSRSSSMSMLRQDFKAPQTQISHPQILTTSQWQPGQSVPVDINQRNEEFRQAAQAARSTESQAFEQPLAFPTDETFVRRGSQASTLANSMGNVNIHTPQPDRSAVFKSPGPPANIAARRQRPRPAPLGPAAMRSQSYSGAAQQFSPAHPHPSTHLTQDRQLRRIRSAVAMNGGVAHGRIMKSTPGSAQRSPVNFSFANAMNTPHFMRSASHGNLAPPTPMSPHDFTRYDPIQQGQSYAVSLPHQPSISEVEFEQHLSSGLSYASSGSGSSQKISSSPPHTPLYFENPYMQRHNTNTIMENTPPQSAPPGQTCFQSNIFATSTPPVPQHKFDQNTMNPPPSTQSQQQMHSHSQRQQTVPTVTFAPTQQSNVTTGPPPGVPLQFAEGIPTKTPEGTIKMSFPPQAQLMQEQSRQMSTPPQTQFAFVNPGSSPSMYYNSQPVSELTMHHYAHPLWTQYAAQRKPVESAQKNFTFANHGPNDFAEKKSKRSETRDSVSSSSPASSIRTASTV